MAMALLQLDPPIDLDFIKTPNEKAIRLLSLKNVHSGHVAFKLKTSAFKAYSAHPSSGTLRPNETLQMRINLLPEGMHSHGGHHRFLIQSTEVSGYEPFTMGMWKDVPSGSIQEQRLTVVLREPEIDDEDEEKKTDRVHRQSHAMQTDDWDEATVMSAGIGVNTADSDCQVSLERKDVEDDGDQNVRYDDVVEYAIALAKENQRLEDDMDSLLLEVMKYPDISKTLSCPSLQRRLTEIPEATVPSQTSPSQQAVKKARFAPLPDLPEGSGRGKTERKNVKRMTAPGTLLKQLPVGTADAAGEVKLSERKRIVQETPALNKHVEVAVQVSDFTEFSALAECQAAPLQVSATPAPATRRHAVSCWAWLRQLCCHL